MMNTSHMYADVLHDNYFAKTSDRKSVIGVDLILCFIACAIHNYIMLSANQKSF